jgi:hypothetical protein
MSWAKVIHRLFRTKPPLQHRERLVAENRWLRFQSDGEAEILVDAEHVVQLWYEYNPFGWQHANSWSVVYASGGDRKRINVFDQDHLKEPFSRWLAENFPKDVSAAFESRFGRPGGDDESELVWQRENENGG